MPLATIQNEAPVSLSLDDTIASVNVSESGKSMAAAIDQPHIVVRLKNIRVGISSFSVKYLTALPKVTGMPGSKPGFRGVINVRGKVIPLFDLRMLLGMTSYMAENDQVIQLLVDREQDHKNWIKALFDAVESGNPFTLARNPTQCKFGKWYGTYKPENQSVGFLTLLNAFDRPHRQIHSIADKVLDLASQGKQDQAKAIIAETRDKELQEMIQIFEKARVSLRDNTREVAIVLNRDNIEFAVVADEVLAIERFDTIEPVSEKTPYDHSRLTPWVARRKGSDSIVLLLDPTQMP